MSEKKTSVTHFVEELVRRQFINYCDENTTDINKLIDDTLQIEKQQHRITWSDAIKAHEERGHNTSRSEADFDEYYMENYGKETDL